MNQYKYIDEKGEHMHTLQGKPLIGTSSVSNVLAKPLTWWAAGLAVEKYGWLNPKYNTEDARKEKVSAFMVQTEGYVGEDWLKLGDEAYKAHATNLKDKAAEGTDLHAELERFVKNHMITKGKAIDTTEYDPKIQPFIDWTEKEVEYFIWSEANCYSEKMWTGGISDAGAKLKNGKTIIIDFKSSKEAYLSQYWQCVGYAMQIEENGWFDKDGNQLGKLEAPIDYVCVVPFGAKKVEPQFYYDMEGGKEAFQCEVTLYKKLNN